jgi:hypothetical protein
MIEPVKAVVIEQNRKWMQGSWEQVQRANRLQRARHEAAVEAAMISMRGRTPPIQFMTPEPGPTAGRNPLSISPAPKPRRSSQWGSDDVLTTVPVEIGTRHNRAEIIATNTSRSAGIMATAPKRGRGEVSDEGSSGQSESPPRERPPRPTSSPARGSPHGPSLRRRIQPEESPGMNRQASKVSLFLMSESDLSPNPQGGRPLKEGQQRKNQQKGGQDTQQGEGSQRGRLQRVSPERESQPKGRGQSAISQRRSSEAESKSKESSLRRSPISQSQPSLNPEREGGRMTGQVELSPRPPRRPRNSPTSLSPLLARTQQGESQQGGSQSRGGQQAESRQGIRSQVNPRSGMVATLTSGLANLRLLRGGSDRRHRGSGRAGASARSSAGLISRRTARSSAGAMLGGRTGANTNPVGAEIQAEYEAKPDANQEGRRSRRGSDAPTARIANPARVATTSETKSFSPISN